MNIREKFLQKAKEQTKEALSKRDLLLARMERSIEALDEAINILYEKLEEMYSLYFPELKISETKKYVELIIAIESKDNIEIEKIKNIVSEAKAKEIAENAKKSVGAKLNENDILTIKNYAKALLKLFEAREEMENYMKKVAHEVCPNVCELANENIAARLIAKVGSLEKLALMPASTLQVIGAEKALFKHLKAKRKIKPPKHGIIFQYPDIVSSPKKIRGKIARAVATKISIAAKADAFTRAFIAPMLKNELKKRIEKIKEDFKKSRDKK